MTSPPGTTTSVTGAPGRGSSPSGWSALPPALRVTVYVLVVALAASLLAVGTLWFVQRDRALPNTEVAGVDVSSMTAPEVREALAPLATERETDATTFVFEGEEHVLVPSDVGYRVDVDATIERVMERGREGLPGDVSVRLRSYRNAATVELVERPDEAALDVWVTELADRLDRPEIRGDVTIAADTASVTVTPSQGLVVVDREVLREAALTSLLEPGSEQLEIQAETAPPPIAQADLDAVGEQVQRALAEALTLRSGDAQLVLEPPDLARLAVIRETDGGTTGTTLELAVTPDTVEDVMGEVAPGRFDIAPVSATYSASRTPPVTFDDQGSTTFEPVEASVSVEGGRLGARFDAETAAVQLTELLREGIREAAIGLVEVEPDLSPQRAEELRPTHVLGTFTTYFQAGAVRNENIALLADTVDGALILPGEQFSINEISGERSCDKGYQPAGTIVQGELVDTCGGGTSQFGTTTFNAAFFSGVALDQWKAHSWYISRYPMGREATLSYPQLDVKFTNTTEGAILVKTANSPSSVTVTIYGQPRAESVSATLGSPTNPRTFSTEVRTTSELFVGQERILQSGTDGFTVEVVRDIELLGGGRDSQTITTVYVPQTRIIERGTRPRD